MIKSRQKSIVPEGKASTSGSGVRSVVTVQAPSRSDPVQSSALASKNRSASSPDPEQLKGVKA